MKKIRIETDIIELAELSELIQMVPEPQTKLDKVGISILDAVEEKIGKKLVSKRHSIDSFTLSLLYHEAWALNMVLQSIAVNTTLERKIIAKIDKQL